MYTEKKKVGKKFVILISSFNPLKLRGEKKERDADNETSNLWSCEPGAFQVVTVNLGLIQMF